MSDDGLYIRRRTPRRSVRRRPSPRRPFKMGAASTTPPPEDDYDFSDSSSCCSSPPAAAAHAFDSPPRGRDASYRFLTGSTLAGIYSPHISGYLGSAEDLRDDGVHAAPLPALSDASIYKLVRERGRSSLLHRRRSSALSAGRPWGNAVVHHHQNQSASALFVGLRTGLLFLLGMGYGVILTRLSSEQQWASFSLDGIIRPGHAEMYLGAWGLCGVVLGRLLPWFDGKWEQIFEKGEDEDEFVEEVSGQDHGTDWALVVRGIGAFAGIVFAIRKVPWASTMQASLTLFMSNPLLWYLIDRSKPGLLFSATTGLVGSIVLMGLNPDIMPTPTGYAGAGEGEYLDRNLTGQPGAEPPLMLGGLATQKTIETGIWVISVLFCSCVCFGNIGRRLALDRSATGRGRWGGLK